VAISVGKEADALKTLAWYHANGDEPDPQVPYEFKEIKTVVDRDYQSRRSLSWDVLGLN